ncbi:MAG: RDD family protein [Spirosomataceae bacterium]
MEGIQIETTQNVTLEYTPASLGDRILAYFIDALVKVAYVVGLVLIGAMLNMQTRGSDLFWVIVIIIAVLPMMFYTLVLEIMMNGQTIGKRAMGIRVVMLDGSQPSLGAYLLRWLLLIVDVHFLSGIVAIIAIASNNRGQRLGDMAAKTTVVKLRPPVGLAQILPPQITEEHRVSFPEVSMLTDRDIAVVKAVLNKNPNENYALLLQAMQKIKEVTGIQSSLEPEAFLRTVLKDYTHIVTKDYNDNERV